MKYIDKIIKYLSGDLDSSEEKEFKKKLEKDIEFASEFEVIQNIWIAMKEKFKVAEQTDKLSIEEIIAEIEAGIDTEYYQRETLSSKERRFTEKMDSIIHEKNKKPNNGRKDYLSFGLLTAAIIAILIIIFYPDPDPYSLAKKYYHPSQENMLIDKVQSTPRGNFSRGYHYFAEEEFPDARAAFENEHKSQAYNDFAKLFYALSCFETGSKDAALLLLDSLSSSPLTEIREASYWYYGILLILEENEEEALSKLSMLHKDSDHYREAQKIIALLKRNSDR